MASICTRGGLDYANTFHEKDSKALEQTVQKSSEVPGSIQNTCDYGLKTWFSGGNAGLTI